MENLETLKRLLREFGYKKVDYALANLHWPTVEGTTEAQKKAAYYSALMSAAESVDEAQNAIIEMFERERARVEKLSEWLTSTTQTLAEVTASIGHRRKAGRMTTACPYRAECLEKWRVARPDFRCAFERYNLLENCPHHERQQQQHQTKTAGPGRMDTDHLEQRNRDRQRARRNGAALQLPLGV